MSRSPEASFQTLFARLDAEARREFVAALYAARGWESRVEDGIIVASRDGEMRRIAVVQPRRFGSPALPDVDTVVASMASDAIRTTAERRGMEYETPTDLRNRLLYGLDREEAEPLFRDHFDRPLSSIESSGEPDGTATSAASALSVPVPTADRFRVLVIVLLVAAVLVAGAGLVPDTDSPSAPPEPNNTHTAGSVGAIGGEETYPAGLGPDGVEDARELSYAHIRFLENNSRTYRITASGPQHAAYMNGLSSWNATVHVENDSRYRFRRTGVAPHGFQTQNRTLRDGENVTFWNPIRNPSSHNSTGREELTLQVYANETTKVWRVNAPYGVHYRRLTAAEVNSSYERALFSFTDRAASVNLYIRQFLDTDSSRIHCQESTDTGDCRTYRIVATGDPGVRGDVADYQGTAVVESTGFVRSLTARYTLPRLDNPEERVWVQFHLNYVGVGNESVPDRPPAWVKTATNRTAENDTAQQTDGTATEQP